MFFLIFVPSCFARIYNLDVTGLSNAIELVAKNSSVLAQLGKDHTLEEIRRQTTQKRCSFREEW